MSVGFENGFCCCADSCHDGVGHCLLVVMKILLVFLLLLKVLLNIWSVKIIIKSVIKYIEC